MRNPLYYRQMELLKEDLHLSMAVNPELAAANEISRMLLFPEANKVESFMKGRVELVEFPISETSPIVGLSLAEINKKYDIGLPDNDEYETLGGLITYYNENIPKEKEEVRVENFLFTVLKTSKNRLETVSLKILSE